MNCPVIIHTFFVKASTDNTNFLDLYLLCDKIPTQRIKRQKMAKKNENIDINTRLKYELYGQMAACGILMAAVIVYSLITRDKKQLPDTNIVPKIENVSPVKSIVTDSVAQRVR